MHPRFTASTNNAAQPQRCRSPGRIAGALLALVLLGPDAAYAQEANAETARSRTARSRTARSETAAPRKRARKARRPPSARWPAHYRGHFEFKDAELPVIARRISDLTGRNVILGDKARGKLTILGPTKVNRAQAWQAFLAALQSLELAAVKVGRFWRIVAIADAKTEPGPILDLRGGSAD